MERYNKSIFLLSWLANLALFLLVLFVLLKTIAAPTEQPIEIIMSYAAFCILFVLFSIDLAIHLKTKNYVSMVFLIVLMIAQFITVIVVGISIFADERVSEKLNFSLNPTKWITSHRWLPILFIVVFLPVFFIQAYVINHHSQTNRTLTTARAQDEADYLSKNAPRQGQQKGQYIAAQTTE